MYSKEHDIRLPLKLEGIISYLQCRTPTNDELDTLPTVIDLTPTTNIWDPHDNKYNEQEASMVDYKGELKLPKERQFIVSKLMSSPLEDNNFGIAINNRLSNSGMSDKYVFSLRTANGKDSTITPKDLAIRWNIGLDTATKTLQATTLLCPRNTDSISLNRRYPNNDRMLRYRRLMTPMFSDTMFASKRAGKSQRNFTCAQIFATDFGWIEAIPMEAERDLHLAFKYVFKEYGVPESMIVDGAKSQVQGKTKELCNMAQCEIRELEKDTPAANRAERAIQSLKNDTKKDMSRTNSPLIFWCYCIERKATIHQLSAKNNFYLNGMVPHSKLTGDRADISHIANFEWYEWVKFRREGPKAAFPYPTEQLGRCLGPARSKGNSMSQHILTELGEVIPVQTVRRLTQNEIDNPNETHRRQQFDNAIKKRYGDSANPPDNWLQRRRKKGDEMQHEDPSHQPNDISDDSEHKVYTDLEGNVEHSVPEADDIPDYDLFLNAEVLLPQDGEYLQAARVIGRSKDEDGMPVGLYNSNPILNTRVYDVEFPDGGIRQYSANIIAENIFSQVDEDGYRYQLLDEIIDCKRDETAIEKTDGYLVDKNGRKRRRITTKGWKFLVAWKDGQQSWVPLKDIKETHPIEVAEYVKAHSLIDEPAFAWWAPYTLKKRDRVIMTVNARLRKKTHKFGIELPTSVAHAYELDRKNGNDFWRKAIAKEMGNVLIAFHILAEGEDPPMNLKELGVHIIFDIKMDLTRKARLVAEGHKTPTPEGSTYAGVVSRETVRIALTYAALLGLDVMAADILNAYLTAPTSENFYITCGPEFGPEFEGRKAIVTRALYGTKSAGRDFRNHLRDCMQHMGYTSCKADPDLWIRKGKRDNGRDYYEYMLLYVDDCLCVSEHPKESLNKLGKYFTLKPGSVGPPKIYLGAKISKVLLPNGVEAYAMSASQYIQEGVKNVEAYLKKQNMVLRKGTKSPMTSNYQPECDITPELDSVNASYYASLIGILRWIVEMGRIDITCEVSMLSSFIAMPREGHLQQVFHIFSYLKMHHNSRIVMDPSYPEIDEDDFKKMDWSSFYGETKEIKPPNMPDPLGKEFIIRAYVDADFAGDKVTRRSRTGFVVMINSSPIYWFSKKQTACETSSFGSEFIAMRQCCEYLRGLRYKLRMMGIPVENPCFIYGDNQSVLWNTSKPESVLKKKTSSVAYHYVREGVSADEWRTAYINTKLNPSDILTKNLPAGINRYNKVRMLLYDIFPE